MDATSSRNINLKCSYSLFRTVILLMVYFSAIFSNSESLTSPRDHLCEKNDLQCKNGKCIDELRGCDDHDDCGDNSDETSCGASYCNLDEQFLCSDGKCIDRGLVCNGAEECDNDEDHCFDDMACPQGKFGCDAGRCIPNRWKCDGNPDCKDRKDEEKCPIDKICPHGYASCNGTKCILKEYFCDGNSECENNNDEFHCGNITNCLLGKGLFLCNDHSKCIKKVLVCDNVYHCNDHSDEHGRCSEACDNLRTKCEHECYQTPDGPQCMCNEGYKYAPDHRTCHDIDECNDTTLVCDHFCHNKEGTYQCSCAKNYDLLRDGATCRIETPALLLFSVGNSIKGAHLGSHDVFLIWEGDQKTSGVAYDPVHKDVYWIENGERVLFKNLYKNEAPKIFIHQGLRQPENLVIDWLGRNIYVADYKLNHMLVCSLETEDCVPILKGLTKPRALQVDLQNRHIYWTNLKSHAIERAGLDGSQNETIVKTDIVWPNGLAIDHPASRLYWADANLNQIGSCNFDGKDRKSLPLTDASHTYSLALWQDRIYWTDWEEDYHNEIHSCRKRDGEQWKPVYKDEEKGVESLTIHHPSMFKHKKSPCPDFDLRCSHLCLLSPSNSRGYVCACPEEMELASNGHMCHEKEVTVPLVAVRSRLYGVPLRNYGNVNPQLRKYARLNLGVVADMDYNPLEDIVFFADAKNEMISAVSLSNRTVYTILKHIKQPISVAIDWLRDNIYWINGFHHTVEVARISGNFRRTVNNNLRNPMDLALDVVGGKIFISDAGLFATIVKCNLNGSDCEVIAHDRIMKPTSIFLDNTVEPKRVYWTDSERNTIESVDVFGRDRKNDFDDLHHPMKIYVDTDRIMWTERRSNYLYVASKNESIDTFGINLELETKSEDEWILALTVVGGPKLNIRDNPCFSRKICSQLCFTKAERDETVCSCAQGFALDKDGYKCVEQKCKPNEKKCDNNECIPKFTWCDGSADCDDESDESNCSNHKNCTKSEFECKSGLCVYDSDRCDGINDCPDKSDEDRLMCGNKYRNCTHDDDWQCSSGQCIPRYFICNKIKDCEDGTDEMECPAEIKCEEGSRKCHKSGWCIQNKWWCDDEVDCHPHGEDEIGCPCKLGEYRCGNETCLDVNQLCKGEIFCGEDKPVNLSCPSPTLFFEDICPGGSLPCNAGSKDLQCVPSAAWCNKTVDCKNKADELNCKTTCKDEMVSCNEGDTCIEKRWRCDGENDCQKGSDEENCFPNEFSTLPNQIIEVVTDHIKSRCSADEFECPDGSCIHSGKICDGKSDCYNGVDEAGDCNKCSHDNGGCQHNCHNNPIKVRCSCKEGYELSPDGYSCHDIDECQDEEVCHHTCDNYKGSHVCSCLKGYTLISDGITCKPTDGGHWSVAAIHRKSYMYMNEQLKKSGLPTAIPAHLNVTSSKFIYDPKHKEIFCVDGEKGNLHKRSTSGAWTSEPVGVSGISATTFDYINRNLYIAKPNVISRRINEDEVESKLLGTNIKVYNLESKTSGHLITLQGRLISAMELSIPLREMVTCECENECNGRSTSLILRKVDGSEISNLATKKVMMCNYIAIDEVKKRIYWLDSLLNKIESVDVWGHRRRAFTTQELHGGRGLAMLDHNLLWYNVQYQTLVKCSIKDPGSCISTTFNGEISIINIEPFYDMSVHTSCQGSICDHICIPGTPTVPHCICQDGFFNSKEKRICVPHSEKGEQKPKVEGNCASGPCVKGICERISTRHIYCRCPTGYQGAYCEISVVKTPDTTGHKVLVGVTLFFVFVGLIVFGFLCYKNRSIKLWKRSGPYARFSFKTASFDRMKEEDSSSQPPTPGMKPKERHQKTMLEKQTSQNSNDSAIVIEPTSRSNTDDYTYKVDLLTPDKSKTKIQSIKGKLDFSPFHL